MSLSRDDEDLLHAARCEDLTSDQIEKLTVLSHSEQDIVDTLKRPGAHLLEGARGVGKSMLLRSAELQLDKCFKGSRQLAIYVNFKTSTLLEGVKAGERDAFQLWVNTKILQSLHEKLLLLDLIAKGGDHDPFEKLFRIPSVETVRTFLQEKIHQLQKLARSKQKDAAL